MQPGGGPPVAGALLFGALTGAGVLTFNFAADLNEPFSGVYQVRRSASASSLLAARRLLEPHLKGGLAFERRLRAGLYSKTELAALAMPLDLDPDLEMDRQQSNDSFRCDGEPDAEGDDL